MYKRTFVFCSIWLSVLAQVYGMAVPPTTTEPSAITHQQSTLVHSKGNEKVWGTPVVTKTHTLFIRASTPRATPADVADDLLLDLEQLNKSIKCHSCNVQTTRSTSTVKATPKVTNTTRTVYSTKATSTVKTATRTVSTPTPTPTLEGDPSKFKYARATFEYYGVVGYAHFTWNGTTTLGQIKIERGLPRNGSEGYPIHIHEQPVPANGSCAATLGHLDPFKVKQAYGDQYRCDPTDLNTCEIGDLSGKHGLLRPLPGNDWLTGTDTLTFLDPQLGWDRKVRETCILGRSLTIHRAGDNIRYTCANILETDQDGNILWSAIQAELNANAAPSTHSPPSPIHLFLSLCLVFLAHRFTVY
jgi:Cu/Zn superoxide dismutase